MSKKHIVYGVAGEGLGHSMRALAVAPKLLKMGYSITFLVGEKSSEFLRRSFRHNSDVDFIEIPLPVFSYDDEKNLNIFQTIKKFVLDWPKRRCATQRVIKDLGLSGKKIDLFVTDYEPITAWTANKMGIPLVVFNSQDFYRHAYFFKIPWNFWPYFFAIKLSCWYFGFGRVETIVCHYDKSHIKSTDNLYSIDPTIRESIVNMKRFNSYDYTLAYIHPSVEKFVVPELMKSKHPVYIFGLGEREHGPDSHLYFLETDEDRFKSNLAGASRVVCCAGTTLPSECLYLKIPMLLIPIPGQKEQEFNGFLFSQYGVPVISKGNISNISDFVNNDPRFGNIVDKYPEIADGSPTAARIIHSIICKNNE